MKKCIFTVGCSGSGKSTWAKDQKNFVIVERDILRRQLLSQSPIGYIPGRLWVDWNFKNEKEVTVLANDIQNLFVSCNENIIFSDTNLNKDRLLGKMQQMEDLGYQVEVKYFPVKDIDVLFKRDRQRMESVGETVIRNQWKQWLSFGSAVTGIQRYEPNPKLPIAVVVDIDGTVADYADLRGPFEWHKVSLDNPRLHVINIIQLLKAQGRKVIFLSGRDSVCREDTVKWINCYFGWLEHFDYELFMRAEKDMRKDREIKDELFFKHVANRYYVEFCFDDRKQMIQYWEDIGLNCINVGKPYDNF